MIIAGVLGELPVPCFEREPLLEGASLVDLYRTVERLIEQFEDICRSVASILIEGSCHTSQPSIMNLRVGGVIETNTKLIKIASEMRDIAKELRGIVTSEGAVFSKLNLVSQLCTVISHLENRFMVVLATPKELPWYLIEPRSLADAPSWYTEIREAAGEFFEFEDKPDRGCDLIAAGEISDLERIVLDMESYRSALRSAVANLTAPDQ